MTVKHDNETAQVIAEAASKLQAHRKLNGNYLKRMSVKLAQQLDLPLPTNKFNHENCVGCGESLLWIHLDAEGFCLKCRRQKNGS